jgi:hypothetical protein
MTVKEPINDVWELLRNIGLHPLAAFPLQSEQVDELAQALSKFQAEVSPALKESKNPFLKSSYADLESCWNAARQPLSDNGLAVTQTTRILPSGRQVLVTTLMHSSGQWCRGELYLAGASDDPQKQGSAVTYARRYAFSAILGLVQSDDDGEAAMNRGGEKKEAPKSAPKSTTGTNTGAPANSSAQAASAGTGKADPKSGGAGNVADKEKTAATAPAGKSQPQATAPAPATTNDPKGAAPSAGSSAATAAGTPPGAKVGKEQMNQLLAAGEKNGWNRDQLSKFVCFAFKLEAKTFAQNITWQQWETAVKLVSHPKNKNGTVYFSIVGEPLPAERCWPQEAQ